MPLRTATSLITSARMFVAVGRGARLGQATSRPAICLNVTFTGAASIRNAAACVAVGAAEAPLAGEEVVVQHLVQAHPLVVDLVLVVAAVAEYPALPLVVPDPWFRSGCRCRSI